jgi:hypothetical protein
LSAKVEKLNAGNGSRELTSRKYELIEILNCQEYEMERKTRVVCTSEQ